jgi:hypothetical protein
VCFGNNRSPYYWWWDGSMAFEANVSPFESTCHVERTESCHIFGIELLLRPLGDLDYCVSTETCRVPAACSYVGYAQVGMIGFSGQAVCCTNHAPPPQPKLYWQILELRQHLMQCASNLVRLLLT